MKLKSFLNVAATGLACLEMLLPTDVMAAGQEAKSKPSPSRVSQKKDSSSEARPKASSARRKVQIIDVELAKDGSLHGDIINARKQSVKDAVVSVRTAKQELGRALSDKDGAFSVQKLPTGTFYIVAGSSHGVYRLWKAGTAPKNAKKRIRFISDRAIIRAQNGTEGRVLFDEDGTAYGQVRIVDNGGLVQAPPNAALGFNGGSGLLDGLGVFDAILIGGVITGATFGIINYNKNDDIESNQNANTP